MTEGPAASYPNNYYYTEIDITDYLSEGVACFAIHTYYQGLINRVWVSGDLKQMMWCELYLDGEKILESDESWLTKYHTGYTECGKFGYDTAYAECYDAASPDTKFYEPNFDDSDFIFAKKNLLSDWKLTKQPTKQLDIYHVSPEKISKIPGGVRLYFTSEAIGMLEFDAIGKRGDKITLRYGEELATDGGAWLNMISEGATLTYEAWGKEQKWNTSLCHPWACAPIIIFADSVRPY